MNWISVEDRLPEDDSKVLAYWVGDKGYNFCFVSQYFNNTRYEPTWTYGFSDDGRITHWQPLPEPPTK